MVTFFLLINIAFLFVILLFYASRYKKCPSDKVIVVYGKGSNNGAAAKCVHNSGVFVMPLIEDYGILSLEPMKTDLDIKAALCKENLKLNLKATCIFCISTEPKLLQNAAKRLLSRSKNEIISMASDISLGQMRIAIAETSIKDIAEDSKKLAKLFKERIESEINKFGLSIINIAIKEIDDEVDYIKTMNKEATIKYSTKISPDEYKEVIEKIFGITLDNLKRPQEVEKRIIEKLEMLGKNFPGQ